MDLDLFVWLFQRLKNDYTCITAFFCQSNKNREENSHL